MVQSDELRLNLDWPALPESDPSDEMDYIFIGSLAWLIITAAMEGTAFLLFIFIPIFLLEGRLNIEYEFSFLIESKPKDTMTWHVFHQSK